MHLIFLADKNNSKKFPQRREISITSNSHRNKVRFTQPYLFLYQWSAILFQSCFLSAAFFCINILSNLGGILHIGLNARPSILYSHRHRYNGMCWNNDKLTEGYADGGIGIVAAISYHLWNLLHPTRGIRESHFCDTIPLRSTRGMRSGRRGGYCGDVWECTSVYEESATTSLRDTRTRRVINQRPGAK